MRIYEKLHYIFFLVAAAYIGLVIFGYLDYEKTQSIFLLLLLAACFGISYFLTKEYIWKYDFGKMMSYGLVYGIIVGAVIFIYVSWKYGVIYVNFERNIYKIEFERIFSSIVSLIFIVFCCCVGFVSGSWLANFLRKEEEETKEKYY